MREEGEKVVSQNEVDNPVKSQQSEVEIPKTKDQSSQSQDDQANQSQVASSQESCSKQESS